jgi:hypothetical protein
LLSERLAARVAAIALIPLAVFADFHGLNLAVVTGHYEPCLSLAIGSQCGVSKAGSEQSLLVFKGADSYKLSAP